MAGMDRWTVTLPDGTLMCAHCEDYEYPPGHNYMSIVLHCREHHREFYAHKWAEEVEATGRTMFYPGLAPLPV